MPLYCREFGRIVFAARVNVKRPASAEVSEVCKQQKCGDLMISFTWAFQFDSGLPLANIAIEKTRKVRWSAFGHSLICDRGVMIHFSMRMKFMHL